MIFCSGDDERAQAYWVYVKSGRRSRDEKATDAIYSGMNRAFPSCIMLMVPFSLTSSFSTTACR